MKLLVIHAVFVLLSIAVVVVTMPSSQPELSTRRRSYDTSRHFKASDSSLQERTGRYLLYPNLRAEFFDFHGVYIPRSEDDFERTFLNGISDTLPDGYGGRVVKSLIVEGDSISFQTIEEDGDSYGFTGSIRLNTRCSPSVTAVGMDGQLTKFRDGVLVATAPVSLYSIYGC